MDFEVNMVQRVLELVIFAIAMGAIFLAFNIARKNEKGLDDHDVLVIKESKVVLVTGIVSVVLFGFFLIVSAIAFYPQDYSGDEAITTYFTLGVFGLFILLGVILILQWKAWEIRLEDELIILRRLFRKAVIIPLTSIARTNPAALVTSGYIEVKFYDYSNKKLFGVRSTLKGYTLLHKHVLAVLPPPNLPIIPMMPQQYQPYYPQQMPTFQQSYPQQQTFKPGKKSK